MAENDAVGTGVVGMASLSPGKPKLPEDFIKQQVANEAVNTALDAVVAQSPEAGPLVREAVAKTAVAQTGTWKPRTVAARPVSSVATAPKSQVTETTTKVPSAPTAPKPSAPKPVAKPMSSLVDRVASMMEIGSGSPPDSLVHFDADRLGEGYMHVLLFGPANGWKTSTAAMFGGPDRTAIIVTRRAEQLIPLQGMGFKWTTVVTDAAALRYALLYPEKIWPEWAKRSDRVLVLDDITEGQDMLVKDFMVYFDEKKGEMVEMKDPRRAYKKAGDEYHDLLKINLGRPQHVILTAVERTFNVEGTIDYRTEPDVPNKVMILTETELEYVFYMELDKDEMLTKTRTQVRSEKNLETKKDETWRDVTFAKSKIPLRLIGKNVLLPAERKNLAAVWTKLVTSMSTADVEKKG